MNELRGKVAVVTGAAGGIGLALCERLAVEGMRVVLADVDADRLAAAADRLGADALAVPTDVASWESVQALERAAVERFGAVHVLCNNAGVTLPGRRVWNVRLEDLDWMLRINLWGAVHGIKAFVPGMIERGEPAHVVNTASVSGLLGFAAIGPYSASKFAVVGLSESLFHDLREKGVPVGVSVLCPCATATAIGANSDRLRPAADGAGRPPAETAGETLPPGAVAAAVVDGIRADRFWILTHPGYADLLELRQRTLRGSGEELVAPGYFL
jgi:NAD(P)-dependent dehydrogenase (short-subunit alcohol dehydrogenase family)